MEDNKVIKLIDGIPTDTVRDLRDRALIATLTYSFARITAALKMKVEDLRPQGAGWRVRLHEKGGKQHEMPCRFTGLWNENDNLGVVGEPVPPDRLLQYSLPTTRLDRGGDAGWTTEAHRLALRFL